MSRPTAVINGNIDFLMLAGSIISCCFESGGLRELLSKEIFSLSANKGRVVPDENVLGRENAANLVAAAVLLLLLLVLCVVSNLPSTL